MHLLSEVILNEKLSINDDAKRVIELLTGKSVPSVEVSKAINPNRSLEKASCNFLMTAIRKMTLYMLNL